MKLDAHQHFWHYDPVAYGWISEDMPQLRRNWLPDDVAPLLQAAGLEAGIAVQARQELAETDFLLDLAEAYSTVAGVVGWVDLQDPALLEVLQPYRERSKLKGFRHIVQDEPDQNFLLRPAFVAGVRQLGAAGYTYDILVYERQLPTVVRFLEHCPDQSLVLDHLGKPVIEGGPSRAWRESLQLIAAHPNVYCKLSGLVTEASWSNWTAEELWPYLDVALEAFGPDRLMLGSDWPVCLLAADSYGQTVGVVQQYLERQGIAQQEAILGGNATHFYQIEDNGSKITG